MFCDFFFSFIFFLVLLVLPAVADPKHGPPSCCPLVRGPPTRSSARIARLTFASVRPSPPPDSPLVMPPRFPSSFHFFCHDPRTSGFVVVMGRSGICRQHFPNRFVTFSLFATCRRGNFEAVGSFRLSIFFRLASFRTCFLLDPQVCFSLFLSTRAFDFTATLILRHTGLDCRASLAVFFLFFVPFSLLKTLVL